MPEILDGLNKLREASPEWAVLIEHFDELRSLLQEDLAPSTSESRQTSRRIDELLKSVAEKPASPGL